VAAILNQAEGNHPTKTDSVDKTTRTWEESMLNALDRLRDDLRQKDPHWIAAHCGATFNENRITLTYWGEERSIHWPELEIVDSHEKFISTFDTAMILYYLHAADGTPMADQWISFRELPNGAFYNQAFQGYSGNRLAKTFGKTPDKFDEVARSLGGWKLPAIGDYAYAFQAFPRIRLAAIIWIGDEEFPTTASILFDASASHYMVTDGLALLGSGLTGRLIKKLS
jgi:hypothetical protein